ncbi:hypothetical protein DVR09_16395 (plasmid) [Erythrobacter aureus]|uniref:Uncharacterized protein n=1 Tax=Erythrobacter aureus TaxID=2182384 RepID=A0A345YJD0_9SPHN|nr:hypothetical protein DVR09_16395 [Erythrobacter aureus]
MPPQLFGPLSSPARRAYARLLLALYHEFFDGEAFGTHRKEDIISFIAVEISRNADMADEFAAESHNADLSQNPANVYRRLLDAGWLGEHMQGYVIVVDIDASVSMLYEALDNIDKGEAIHFGGTLASIESVVERLGEEPEDKAPSLATCAQQARRFQQHLTAIVGSLRLYEKEITSRPDPAHILAQFFDQFVEKTLIVDYKALKTRNNPFRHRDAIIATISLYEDDEELLAAFAKGYLDQGLAPTPEEARAKVEQHLYLVKSVFWRVEERLEDIDAFRMRLEKRITRTIAYMGQVDASITGRITSILQGLTELGPDDSEVPVESDFTLHARCWGPDDLATPKTAVQKVEPAAMVIREPNPLIKEYDRRRREFLLRHNIKPERVESYLEAAAGSRASMDASDFTVEDTEQALIFQRLRMIATLPDSDLSSRWKVTFKDGPLLETKYTTCKDFQIERIAPEERSNADAV